MCVMACEHCTDPDGASCVPYYGLGPHRHEGASIIGSTVMEPPENWPTNYREDPGCPGMGVWWCGQCGEGKADDDRLTANGVAGQEGGAA
jgi:hypothetical protein